jgi:hypothetical protein
MRRNSRLQHDSAPSWIPGRIDFHIVSLIYFSQWMFLRFGGDAFMVRIE